MPSTSKKPSSSGKKGRNIDRKPHLLRAAFFVGIFVATFAFVKARTSQARNGAPAPGLKFYPELTRWVSPTFVYGLPLAYVVLVFVACRIMRNLEPKEALVKALQPFYNMTQIVVCAYMTYGLVVTTGIWNGKPMFYMGEESTAHIEYFIFVHYLTKFLDWFDTLFMVLRKKFDQVSFLHVFHHATIGCVWGFLLSEGLFSGTCGFGAFMNSVTHVIMYTHYLVTSFGIRNPFKRYITMWQLFQFATCLFHSICFFIFPSYYHDITLLQVMYQSFMLLLFGNYMNWSPQWLVGFDDASKKKE